MVTERVRTLPTKPTEGEIVKSNPLLSFINSGQSGRIHDIATLSTLLAMFSPAQLPWFVYSNLLQNVSRPFINSTHLT